MEEDCKDENLGEARARATVSRPVLSDSRISIFRHEFLACFLWLNMAFYRGLVRVAVPTGEACGAARGNNRKLSIRYVVDRSGLRHKKTSDSVASQVKAKLGKQPTCTVL